MKKILYLMHVPWGWIKQRPHFFAEYLVKDFAVDVYYKKPILVQKKNLLIQEKNVSGLTIKGFRQIPFEKIPLIKYLRLDFLNRFLLHVQLPNFNEYDYVWFTCPSMYMLFGSMLKSKNEIIYDCMDDVLEFSFCKKNVLLKNKMLHAERELINRSYKIFCSSAYLRDKILVRSNSNREVIVVNNAIELPHAIEFSQLESDNIRFKDIKNLSNPMLYIGTISEWFDFGLLLRLLDKYKNINLVLAGPSNVDIPVHPQIYYLGTINRESIFPLMSYAWCLIMPFKVNELIRSVNPVKLYEYIYAGKHVIASKYGETQKFAKYVNLYETEADFFATIDRLLNMKELPNKQKEEMKQFAKDNTWGARYQIIKKELML